MAERAIGAERLPFLAKAFAGFDNQGVVFVEQGGVGGQGGHEGALDFVIVALFRHEEMAGKDAVGVGIDDENRVPAGVEQNGVGGFRADAGNGEQFASGRRQCIAGDGRNVAMVFAP